MRLARNEVHVWIAVPREAPHADWEALLLDDERRRRDAFVFEKNQIEFLATRGLVRTTLSRYRSIAPAEWRFRNGEHGRPEIDPPCGLRFNLSNHPGLVVCAVCEDADIGVDVEPISRGDEILGIADTVFAPGELATLNGRRDRAVSLWTLKESYIKARGMGLSLPLDRFSFDLDERLSVEPPIVDDVARWTFRTFDVDGFRIALCVDTGGAELAVSLERA
jgi:4'-phosphopantetheinyl transferase